LLGAAQERSGDPKSAAQSFEAALSLDPKDLDTTLHLAELYLSQKRAAEAESKFRAALELQPGLPAALLGLAQSLDAQKKPEAADAYQDYLKTQPNDPAAKENLARSLVAKDQFDAAEALLGPEQLGATPTVESLKLRADIQIGQKKWMLPPQLSNRPSSSLRKTPNSMAVLAACIFSYTTSKTPNSN